jgi:hypothetical protein
MAAARPGGWRSAGGRLMIFPNSRYVNNPVVLVDTPEVFANENGPSIQCIYWNEPADNTFKYK